MIKPLNGISTQYFKGSLEEYQNQIKNKQEPRYNLVVSPGSDYQKPSVKRGVAGIFKGYNNITGVAIGAVKGAVKGIVFGSIAGVIAKNWKENTKKVADEAGKAIPRLNVKGFLGGTFGDLFGFVGKAFKAIPEIFSKAPIDSLKTLKDLPKKYFKYLGNSKAVKAIAIGVGALTLGYTIISSKIQANRKNADIDHSWNLKH